MVTLTPLHFDYQKIGKGKTFLEVYAKVLKANSIDFKFLRYQNNSRFWDAIDRSKLFIARYRGIESDLSLMHAILPEIERRGIPTLPNFKTAYHCGDKLRIATFYESNAINHPKTKLFWEFDELMNSIDSNSLEYPLVAKLRRGAASTNVIMVYSKKELIRLGKNLLQKGVKPGMLEEAAYGKLYVLYLLKKAILNPKSQNIKNLRHKLHYILSRDLREMESSCLILQDFLSGNNGDTRITVIGDRAFGFRRYNRKGDFRASGSGLVDHDPNGIDIEMIKMAFDISKRFNFQTMAYDFVYDKNRKPSILENNFTYVDSAVAKCPVYWNSKGETFANNNTLPQYWQLVDAFEDKNLKYFK